MCRVVSDGGKLLIPSLTAQGLPLSHYLGETQLTLIPKGGVREQKAGLEDGESKCQICQTIDVLP